MSSKCIEKGSGENPLITGLEEGNPVGYGPRGIFGKSRDQAAKFAAFPQTEFFFILVPLVIFMDREGMVTTTA
jgi:hypothetical protein